MSRKNSDNGVDFSAEASELAADEYGNMHGQTGETSGEYADYSQGANHDEAAEQKRVKREIAVMNNNMVDEFTRWIRRYVDEACREDSCTINRSEFQDALEMILDTSVDKKLVNRAIRKAVKLGTLVETSRNVFTVSEARKRIMHLADRAKNPQTR